jgi:hypothetical protein
LSKEAAPEGALVEEESGCAIIFFALKKLMRQKYD